MDWFHLLPFIGTFSSYYFHIQLALSILARVILLKQYTQFHVSYVVKANSSSDKAPSACQCWVRWGQSVWTCGNPYKHLSTLPQN